MGKSKTSTTEERGARPAYPTKKTCKCTQEGDGEPEWEWDSDNVWSCLGCGQTIEKEGSRFKVLY